MAFGSMHCKSNFRNVEIHVRKQLVIRIFDTDFENVRKKITNIRKPKSNRRIDRPGAGSGGLILLKKDRRI